MRESLNGPSCLFFGVRHQSEQYDHAGANLIALKKFAHLLCQQIVACGPGHRLLRVLSDKHCRAQTCSMHLHDQATKSTEQHVGTESKNVKDTS